MKRFLLVFMALACFIACAGLNVAGAQEEAFELTILHTNDHHSHLDGQTMDLVVDFDSKQESEKVRLKVGGMPYLDTLLTTLRSDNSLYLQSGELNGTLYFSLYKGKVDFEVINEMAPDAYMVGNHEFDEGDAVLAGLIESAKFPMLAGNVVPLNASPLYGKLSIPYIVKEIGGEKVAVIGVLKIEKTKHSSMVSDDVEFIDEIGFVIEKVAEIKADGINKIILLSHLGFEFDQALASKTTDIDAIIGGDTHNLLDSKGEAAKLGLPVSGDYPTAVKNKDGKDVYIVQAWEYANALGKLTLTFDAQGEVTKVQGGTMIPVGGPYLVNNGEKWVEAEGETLKAIQKAIATSQVLVDGVESERIVDILSPYKADLQAQMDVVLGSVATTLSNERIPTPFAAGETANGSFAAQVVANAFLYYLPQADVAIQNAGGVRENFLEGKFTMADAYTMLPFSNTIATLKLTGQEIVSVLDEAIRYSQGISKSTGAFPYASHLRYDVYLNAADGVLSAYNVEVKDRQTSEWASIDLDKRYTVVTNSFTALGKDGYVTFAKAVEADSTILENTYVEYAVPLIEYFKKQLGGGELAVPDADSYCIKSVTAK